MRVRENLLLDLDLLVIVAVAVLAVVRRGRSKCCRFAALASVLAHARRVDHVVLLQIRVDFEAQPALHALVLALFDKQAELSRNAMKTAKRALASSTLTVPVRITVPEIEIRW